MKDLILTSLLAQQEYVTNRIKSPKNQLYYTEMMDYIVVLLTKFDSPQVPLVLLEHVFSKLRPQLFSLNSELKYKKLAIKHASETVIAITNRFNGKLYVKG